MVVIPLVHGRTLRITFKLKNQDLTPFEWSKVAIAVFTMKASLADPDASALLRGSLETGEITCLDEATCDVEVRFSPAQTKAINMAGARTLDCEFDCAIRTNDTPDDIYTVLDGQIRLRAPVTVDVPEIVIP
jgi:hypothetical protein